MEKWLISGPWREFERSSFERKGMEYNLLLECAPTQSNVSKEVRPDGGWRVRCTPASPFGTVLFTGKDAKAQATKFRDQRLKTLRG